MITFNCSICGSDNIKKSVKGICYLCYLKQYRIMKLKENPDYYLAQAKKSYHKHRERKQAHDAARLREIRKQVITTLGNKCICCGETTYEFLTVDHINNDGANHRKMIRGSRIIADILKQGCPKDKYQILCYNCNCAKGRWGYCPHQK